MAAAGPAAFGLEQSSTPCPPLPPSRHGAGLRTAGRVQWGRNQTAALDTLIGLSTAARTLESLCKAHSACNQKIKGFTIVN